MEPNLENLPFERMCPVRRAMKGMFINPLANYLPASVTRSILRFTQSELAASNWKDPGGWRSMVISYENNPRKPVDRVLIGGGTMPMALRNRRAAGLDPHGRDHRPVPHRARAGALPGPGRGTSSPTP